MVFNIRPANMHKRTVPNVVASGGPARDKGTDTGTRKWGKVRDAWLRAYPLCVLCTIRGEQAFTPLVVDHITPHRGDCDRMWDQDNWQTLCKHCHDADKKSHEMAGRGASEWFALLRAEMARCGAREHVVELRDYLPERVCRELLGVSLIPAWANVQLECWYCNTFAGAIAHGQKRLF